MLKKFTFFCDLEKFTFYVKKIAFYVKTSRHPAELGLEKNSLCMLKKFNFFNDLEDNLKPKIEILTFAVKPTLEKGSRCPPSMSTRRRAAPPPSSRAATETTR